MASATGGRRGAGYTIGTRGAGRWGDCNGHEWSRTVARNRRSYNKEARLGQLLGGGPEFKSPSLAVGADIRLDRMYGDRAKVRTGAHHQESSRISWCSW
jgi:hypothetical protein